MFSNLRSIWIVFLHMFHKRETVLYPEELRVASSMLIFGGLE